MASIMNAHPKPTVITRTPARAGPTTREPVITALFKLTALVTSSGGTISTTNERRVGLSNAVSTPWQAART